MTIEYITTRDLEDSSGQPKGKLRIVKLAEEETAQLDITCPMCGASEKRNETWAEPFVSGEGAKQKFDVKCSKCSFSTKVLKLKKTLKKK